jgi:CHASE3 domain sensor protein
MTRRTSRLLVLTVRRRIFGGFTIVLLLLALLAAGSLHSTQKVGAEAARVSEDAARAAHATGVAVQVGEARAQVVQYMLTGTMDDRKSAQEALAELDRSIAGQQDSSNSRCELQSRVTAVRSMPRSRRWKLSVWRRSTW